METQERAFRPAPVFGDLRQNVICVMLVNCRETDKGDLRTVPLVLMQCDSGICLEWHKGAKVAF